MNIDGEEKLGNCLSSFVDNGSSESHRYYLARRTLLEMLKDRGHAVPSSDMELSLQEFRDRHGQTPDVDTLKISALHRGDPSLKTLVVFCAPNIVKVNVIRAIVTEIVNRDRLNRLILVVQSKITSQALKAVELISCKVEIFQILDLLMNITKHELKPKHLVLTDEEKESLLKKYSIEEKQLQDYCPGGFRFDNLRLNLCRVYHCFVADCLTCSLNGNCHRRFTFLHNIFNSDVSYIDVFNSFT